MTDFTPPQFKIVGLSPICPSVCSQSHWDLSVNITDGNGSGIESVYTQKGSGNLSYHSVVDEGITTVMGYYNASCCSPDVIITAVDKEGNVGKFAYTIQRSGGVSLSLSLPLWACLLVSVLNIIRDVLPL